MNFLRIYFWQLVSIVFNFAAVFVVTPYFASNQPLYGIYTLVTSAYIFLSYADLGFLSAGMKFAAEAYARGEKEREVKILGFAGFIFLMFVIIYMVAVGIMSADPQVIVKSLTNPYEFSIASRLLLILALFSPLLIPQRLIQIIFAIRLKDYIFQQVLIISNVAKILFAVIFFGEGRYPIVEYFLFSQLCTLGAISVGIYLAKKRLDFNILLLFKNIRFSREIYIRTKNLAFVSLFLSLCWIIYFELDPLVISKMLGANQLAVYAIALTLMSYFRSVFGIIYSPFTARFNHFVGLKDFQGLKQMVQKVMFITVPITVFPVLVVALSMKSFVLSWVGPAYLDSVELARLLVLCYIFSFITSPAGILVMAYERVRLLYFSSALLPVIYWVGILVTFSTFGIYSFSLFKFISFIIAALVYLYILIRLLELEWRKFLLKLFRPVLIPIGIIVFVMFILEPFFPVEKGKTSLLVYFALNGSVMFLATIFYYFCCPVFKDTFNTTAGSMIKRIARS